MDDTLKSAIVLLILGAFFGLWVRYAVKASREQARAAEHERQKAAAAARARAEEQARQQRETEEARAAQQRAVEAQYQRRVDNLARALTAFPGHWTAEQIYNNRHWHDYCSVDLLYPPDVVVHCGENDNIELFKGSRVRAHEAQNEQIKEIRNARAADIREKRRAEQEEKRREAYIQARQSTRNLERGATISQWATCVRFVIVPNLGSALGVREDPRLA